jgi:hypothetical protein
MDLRAFPGLPGLGRLAAPEGSTAVLNAANEVAVEAFLDRRIAFTAIHTVNAARSSRCSRHRDADRRWTPARPRPPFAPRPPGMPRSWPDDHHRACVPVLTLGVLIVVHEYGHYRVAVACGVKVLRFSVGFGRVLWRRQRHPDAPSSCSRRCRWAAMCACSTSARRRWPRTTVTVAFNRKPLWAARRHRAAGPLANLALAVLLYAAAHWIGVDEPKACCPRRRGQPGRAAGLRPATGCDRGRPTGRTGRTCAR